MRSPAPVFFALTGSTPADGRPVRPGDAWLRPRARREPGYGLRRPQARVAGCRWSRAAPSHARSASRAFAPARRAPARSRRRARRSASPQESLMQSSGHSSLTSRIASTRWHRAGRERLIADFDDFDLFRADRRAQRHRVAFARLDERTRHRRHPADVTPRGVDLVDAYDRHGALLAPAVAHVDRRPEKHLARQVVVPRHRRVHHFGGVEALDEETDAAVDLA